jgi:hypothetical protein
MLAGLSAFTLGSPPTGEIAIWLVGIVYGMSFFYAFAGTSLYQVSFTFLLLLLRLVEA